MERRAFFTQLGRGVRKKNAPLLPPYIGEDKEGCIECDAPCISACETKILIKNASGYIEVDFKSQGCTYCKACADICERGVLEETNHPFIKAVVFIEEGLCLAHNGVMCMSCKEPCTAEAIQFEGLFKPQIQSSLCTACGFCISRCPAAAIMVVA